MNEDNTSSCPCNGDTAKPCKKCVDAQYIQKNDDGSTTVILQYAVERSNNKGDLTEITMNRLRVCDIEASDSAKGDIAGTILIVSSLSNVPAALIRKMDMVDYNRVAGILMAEHGSDDPEKKSQATGGE